MGRIEPARRWTSRYPPGHKGQTRYLLLQTVRGETKTSASVSPLSNRAEHRFRTRSRFSTAVPKWQPQQLFTALSHPSSPSHSSPPCAD